MNIGNPDRAFAFRALPSAEGGLARPEFIIGNPIGVHPRALLDFGRLPEALRERAAGYEDPESFFVEKLVEGVPTIAMGEGIDSVSLNPDSVVETRLYLGGESAD